jgi:hypothetical protein
MYSSNSNPGYGYPTQWTVPSHRDIHTWQSLLPAVHPGYAIATYGSAPIPSTSSKGQIDLPRVSLKRNRSAASTVSSKKSTKKSRIDSAEAALDYRAKRAIESCRMVTSWAAALRPQAPDVKEALGTACAWILFLGRYRECADEAKRVMRLRMPQIGAYVLKFGLKNY